MDNTVTIQRRDVVERVSANRVARALKLVRPVPAAGPYTNTTADLSANSQSGRTWIFEQVNSHRECDDGSLEFRVQWGGGWRPTWDPIPRTNLPEDAVLQYLARRARAVRLSRKSKPPFAIIANTAVLGAPLFDPHTIQNTDPHDVHSDIPDLSRLWL